MRVIDNFINGKPKRPDSDGYIDVYSPIDNSICSKVALSTEADVEAAIESARVAFETWSALTIKKRCNILRKFSSLIEDNYNELASIINVENGKTVNEALAELAKGNETLEWACGLSIGIQSKVSHQKVSTAVTCRDDLKPVGVCLSIVPFNFPAMVPFWTIPIALATGNCLIVKPSEKCPMTLYEIVCKLSGQAGIPKGVLQLLNGDHTTVRCLINHKDIAAVTFVGSSSVAKKVYTSTTQFGKRCLALGGAKNHLVALEDCDIDMTSSDIVSSFTGCAGQRCMAASVLLIVGTNDVLVKEVVSKAKSLKPGSGKGSMGPVIDSDSKKRILEYLTEVDNSDTAVLLLDGRNEPWDSQQGCYLGPTIIMHTNPSDRALHEEIFGPVLSILKVNSVEEAIRIENASAFGNAACIYTQNGGQAEILSSKFRAGMIGVNIGIPVPREPFSFGGLYGTQSMYGHSDITGDGALSFFTSRVKITTKWAKFSTGKSEDISQFK